MKYDPKQANRCLPEGVYDATILSGEVKERPGKGDMIVIGFEVYSGNSTVRMRDFIPIPEFLWKLKKLAKAIGKMEAFESGEFRREDYQGCSLKLELRVEETDEYGDQNRVWGYQPADGSGAPAAAARPSGVKRHPMPEGYTPIGDEDIPF